MREREAFDVHAYSEAALHELLSGPHFTIENAKQHRQAEYLHGYLAAIGAQTVVLEPEYVDGDYLADFSSYYVSCFERYERFCKRAHFFEIGFDSAQFERIALGLASVEEVSAIKAAYLGFVVVRPLPNAVVGRTALRTYPEDGGRRCYTALVLYRVTLHGVEFCVRSLAYQEQDTVVAACATVAIWSALHRVGHIYGTRIPRPPVITSDATRTLLYQRALPSKGLRLEQMLMAIRAADLEPETYEPMAPWGMRPLSSLIYGYVRGGLPVILVVALEGLGAHAVTIAGYSKTNQRSFTRERPDVYYELDADGNVQKDANGIDLTRPVPDPALPALMGLRLNEFYAHDDGTGPFSRLIVLQPTAGPYKCGEPLSHTRFESQWRLQGGGHRAMQPISVIVPVYPKIRLLFDEALGCAHRLNNLFATALAIPLADAHARSEWDLFITDTNTYKRDVPSLPLTNDRKRGLLVSSQPRFIWRAMFYADNVAKAELLIDATSFSSAFPVFAINWFDGAMASNVSSILKTGLVRNIVTPNYEALILSEIDNREASRVGMDG